MPLAFVPQLSFEDWRFPGVSSDLPPAPASRKEDRIDEEKQVVSYNRTLTTSHGINGIWKPATDQPRNRPATAQGPKFLTAAVE